MNPKVLFFDLDCPEYSKILSIEPVKRSVLKTLIYCLLSLLSLFTLNVLGYFYPYLRLYFNYSTVALEEADFAAVSDSSGQIEMVKLKRNIYSALSKPTLALIDTSFSGKLALTFEFRLFEYIYSFEKAGFVPLELKIKTESNELFTLLASGLMKDDYYTIFGLSGPCDIQIKVKSFFNLVIDIADDFFYFFQAFSCIIFVFSEYYNYLAFIVLSSVSTILLSALQIKQNLKNIAKMTSYSVKLKHFIPNNQGVLKPFLRISKDLTVGSKFEVPQPGEYMPCDAILTGGSMAVSETVLTGEADSVVKEAYTGGKVQEKNILYAGSRVELVRAESPAVAICIAVGFNTKKGTVIRTVMAAQEPTSKFEKDSIKYVKLMFVVSIFLFGVALPFLLEDAGPFDLFIRFSDNITVTVPPALVTCLGISIMSAINALQKKGIKCINPQKITAAGLADCCIFDKTGTLTYNTLGLEGFLLVTNYTKSSKFELNIRKEPRTDCRSSRCLASCHSLVDLESGVEGDPVEKICLSSVGWALTEKGVVYGENKLNFLEKFEFSPQLRSMGVVTEDQADKVKEVFFKGSPERIGKICLPSSLPQDFNSRLDELTSLGLRVLGMCAKTVSTVPQSREEAESDLIFLGFILLNNELKPKSAEVITTLLDCDYEVKMCTGDNLRTATAVAKKCEMFNRSSEISEAVVEGMFVRFNRIYEGDPKRAQFAMTGETFEKLLESSVDLDYKNQIFSKCRVFARMSPTQKGKLVSILSEMGSTTFFIGDGANDCAALREAEVGLCIGESEISFVAPFSGEDIDSTLEVLIEGKAAMCSSIECFKYMMSYAIIQSAQTLILQVLLTYLSDNQFLAIDLFSIIPISMLMSLTKPASSLNKTKVRYDLLGKRVLFPFFFHSAVIFGSIFTSYYLLTLRPWFEPTQYHPVSNFEPSSENTVLFIVGYFYYFVFSFIVHIGKPTRKPFYTNWLLALFTLAGMTMAGVMLFWHNSFVSDKLFNLVQIEDFWLKIQVVTVCIVSSTFCYLGEHTLDSMFV